MAYPAPNLWYDTTKEVRNMATVLKTRVTADEFFDHPIPDCQSELIRGEVLVMSPAGGEHGIVAMRMGSLLFTYVDLHKLGVVCAAETGFILARDPDTVRAPDVAFISNARMGD